MMAHTGSFTLDLPGFSGSMPGISLHVADSDDLRVAYTDNTTHATNAETHRPFKLVSFTSVDELIAFLKSTLVTESADGMEMPVTGSLPGELADALRQLNIRVKEVKHCDIVVAAHRHLFKHLQADQLVLQNATSDEDIKQIFVERDCFTAVLPKMNEINNWATYIPAIEGYKDFILKVTGRTYPKSEVTSTETKPEVTSLSTGSYPCLLVDMENTLSFIKVTEGETYEVLDVHNRAGDAFLGLGSLLCGAKSYNELMTLASRGHHFNIHQTDKTGGKESNSGDEDSVYKTMLDASTTENVYFCFGQAYGKDLGDFTSENLAAGLLYHLFQDITQQLHYYLLADRSIQHVMVSGGLLRHPRARQIFLQEYWRRMLFLATFDPEPPKVPVHILTHAPYYAAVGALVTSQGKL